MSEYKSCDDDSFKIKPLLLELPNYEYYHSSIQNSKEDINKRFVGRNDVISRIQSFVNETSKNTGAYLVSGFRGMGKTSVVNKALSSLNPKQRTGTYITLWLTLLPWSFFSDYCYAFYEGFDEWLLLFTVLGLFIVSSIFIIGKADSRRVKSSTAKTPKTLYMCLLFGVKALGNPKLSKSKFSFQRNLRSLVIYILSVIIILVLIKIVAAENNSREHVVFWVITLSVFIFYCYVDLSKCVLIFLRKKDEDSQEFIWGYSFALLSLFILISVFTYQFCIKANEFILTCALLSIFISLLYAGLKHILLNPKKIPEKNKKTPLQYKTTISRITGFFNLQHYITVKVNLGKDKLTEKDVLKYVTNELYKEYSYWFSNFKNTKRLLNTLLLVLLSYIFLNFLYNGFLGKEFSMFSNRTAQIGIYFPSQSLLVANKEFKSEEIDSLFNKFGENEGPTLDGYIKQIKDNLSDNSIKVGYEDLSNSYLGKNESWPTIRKRIAQFCNEVDYLTLKLWIKTKRLIFYNSLDKKGVVVKSINFIFPNVPPLAIFVLLTLTLLLTRFLPSKLLFFKTHYHALRELKNIKKQIDASITFEESTNANAIRTSWFNFRKSTSYQPLEAKDITQRLIHLLDNIDGVKPIFTKVKFIFVFDELDKINPHDAVVISSREDEFEMETNEVRYQARRKERIANILASMKHFLNSAKAKFIFIAGREMYDAALAGISDRESSLDSIFNDNKIYINSFYTEEDDGNKNDITSITEQYICQFLIPDAFLLSNIGELPSLELYNKYLKEKIYGVSKHKEIDKIIVTLKDFIVYLSYRSNGAPRKLSNLFEQSVKPVVLNDIEDPDRLVVGRNDENLYLSLGYHDQYKFSLISSLTTPVFLGVGNFMHEYSDKLLVSVSYMLDHLFKFHKFGISYRSLSLTPEIIDVNKEPQFREFLDKLVTTLSKSHLRPIVSGIYDYKFHSKISSEIKFLSKIDEQEGAALNFTLDESIELKRYFNKRLEQLKEKGPGIILKGEGRHKQDHINNLGLLHILIGDLHFYDEEYQDAISHYMEAVQNLRQRDISEMVLYDFVLFVRNKLKLALAFEKNKMLDNALMTYAELTDLIIRKRNIPIRKFGLTRFIVTQEDFMFTDSSKLKGNYNVSNKAEMEAALLNSKWGTERNKTNAKEIIVVGRLKPHLALKLNSPKDEVTNYDWKKLYPICEMETFYGLNSNEIIGNIKDVETNYKPLKYNFLQTTGESIRILYQPIIAKLHLIEKTSPDKVKDVDLIRAMEEYDFLKLPLSTEEKRVIGSEVHNKIGDLLYFKNGTLKKCLKTMILDNFEKKNLSVQQEKALKNLLVSPIDAAILYIKSLAILLVPISTGCSRKDDGTSSPPPIAKTIDIIDFYKSKEVNPLLKPREINNSKESNKITFFTNLKTNLDDLIKQIQLITKKESESFGERYPNEYLNSVANGIIDLAGALKSFTKGGYTDKNSPSEFAFVFDALSLELERIIELYYQAYIIFSGIGSHRLAKSQLLKILHILRETKLETVDKKFANENSLSEKSDIDISVNSIVEKAIKSIYATYDYVHLVEGKKISEIFKEEFSIKNHMVKSTIASEVNEVILLLSLLKFKYDREGGLVKKVTASINPNSSVSRKYNRILELNLKLKRKNQCYKSNKGNEVNVSGYLTRQIDIIIDALGANNELLKTHYLFDINYVTTNHCQLAKAHFTMYEWCLRYETFKKQKDMDSNLKEKILNTKTLMNINKLYHLNKALEFNNKAKNFHTRGEPLNSFLKNKSYLDDFFNDNIVHFSIALERNAVQERDNGIDRHLKNINRLINQAEYLHDDSNNENISLLTYYNYKEYIPEINESKKDD